MIVVVVITVIVIILILLSINVSIEGFSYSAFRSDITKFTRELKNTDKRYSRKEFAISDLLKILNCNNRYSFHVVNMEVSDISIKVMLYDTITASVLNLNIMFNKKELFYTISNIEISEEKADNPNRFYDPYFENHPNPFE